MRVPRHGWSLVLIGLLVVAYAYRSRAQGGVKGAPEEPAPLAAAAADDALDPTTGAETPPSAQSEEPDEEQEEPIVAATVNGANILTADLNERAQLLYDRMRPRDRTLSPAEADALFQKVRWRLLNNLINDELKTQAVQEAEGKGEIRLDAQTLDRARTGIARLYPTEVEFRAVHSLTVMNRDQWARRSLLWDSLRRRLSEKVTVAAEEVRAFYDAWPGRWQDGQGNVLSFEQAQGKVQQDLLAEKCGQAVGAWLQQRRETANLNVALPPPPR